MDVIKDIKSFIKEFQKTIGTREVPVEFECECNCCHAIFKVAKSSSRYYHIIKTQQILCRNCAASQAGRENHAKGVDALNRSRALKSQQFQQEVKLQEQQQESIQIGSLSVLKQYANDGGRACTLVCSKCGKKHTIHNRRTLLNYIRAYTGSEDPLICKGCNITSKKLKQSKVNKSFVL